MTRKDYVAIADALARTHPEKPSWGFQSESEQAYDQGQDDQWEEDRAAIADVLAADNPRFDRERFYAACEGK